MSFEEYLPAWCQRAVESELVGGSDMGAAGSSCVAWAEVQVWCSGRRHYGKNRLTDGRLRLTV